jgi:tRNA-specific 2-thiouridylase
MSRVLLAMSGGVDSSASAVLLQRAGHEVLGAFMIHGICGGEASREGKQGCCSRADADDARRTADRLGILFYPVDVRDGFGRIVDYFVSEYDRGATPNPCIVCNRDLKFGRLFEVARTLGAEFVATGHYARAERRGDRTALLRARDRRKDQSYVLFALGPAELDRALFPVGGIEKGEVRRIAAEAGLEVAAKAESQEICFVPDGDHRRLLRERLGNRVREGEFLSRDGRVLGRHPGYQLFTVGQRKGFGVGFGKPMYVVAIRPETNAVVLSEEDERRRDLHVRDVNWIAGEPRAVEAVVQIRYGHAGSAARVEPLEGNRARVILAEPQRAVTPGQAAVFYDGDEVLGGGWIEPFGD